MSIRATYLLRAGPGPPTFAQTINPFVMRIAFPLLAFFLHMATQANWTPHAISTSGNRSITTFNNAIYVAAYNTGIKKSINDGVTWTDANTGLPQTAGQIKVQSVGHNATTLFCGTESGVYRSTDNGASWSSTNGTLTAGPTVYVNKIYTYGGVTFVVFSGQVSQSAGGVFRTVDNGTTWLQAFNGLSANMTIYNIDEVGGTLYASTSTSLMKSTDLGQSWVQAGTTNYAVFAVQAVGTRVVALTTFGARYSLDGGTSWTNSTNYPVASPAAGCELIAYDDKYYAITKSGSLGCYRSLDGGATWEAFNTGLSAQNTFGQEEFHADGDRLYIACILDVYSTPGSTVGFADFNNDLLPKPFPTLFTDRFTMDLSSVPAGMGIMLVDASGRTVRNHLNISGAMAVIERDGLAPGQYRCILTDAQNRNLKDLGPVFAQ